MKPSDPIYLRNIPFEPDFAGLCRRLHVRAGSADESELRLLLHEAIEIAQPVALYRFARVEERQSTGVTISGIEFESRVLRVNLDKTDQVFPFVASCGMALQAWGDRQDDLMRSYWAEAIKEEALLASLAALHREIERRERLGHFSVMSPGSLESWPISQQAPLFDLLGHAGLDAEVRLTDSMLMIPTKSVSGLIFPTDETFESCMLCQREDCPNRRAPYDETLYEREYCPAA